MTLDTSSTANVVVTIYESDETHKSARRVPRHDGNGTERTNQELAREALVRAVRAVYGTRALWTRDDGTSSGLARTNQDIFEYGTVVRDLTDQERRLGHANVIKSRVSAEVRVL